MKSSRLRLLKAFAARGTNATALVAQFALALGIITWAPTASAGLKPYIIMTTGSGRLNADITSTSQGATVTYVPSPSGYFGTANTSFPKGLARQVINGVTVTNWAFTAGAPGGYYATKNAYLGTTGANAGNEDFLAEFPITPSPCAVSYSIEEEVRQVSANRGQFQLQGSVTAGAAIRYVIYEYNYTGNNPEGPTADEVKTNGIVRLQFTAAGPFSTDCPLKIPFEIGDPDDIIVISDAMAYSTEFRVECPGDVTIPCGAPVEYPAATITGGCGDPEKFAVTWDPMPENVPFGTSTVKVRVTDEQNNVAECNFQITRPSLEFSGFEAPLAGASSCAAPLKCFNLGRTLPVKFKLLCGSSPFLTERPSILVQRYRDCSDTSPVTVQVGIAEPGLQEYHFNVDTSKVSQRGIYRISATYGGSIVQEVWMRTR